MKGRYKLNLWTIAITLVLVFVFCIYIVLMPESATGSLNAIRVFLTTTFGSYFIAITIGIFIFNAAIAFSKYGSIRLGKEKPEYKTYSWIAMIFCATMGATLLYWAVLEWVYYYTAPPGGLEPESLEAAQVVLQYNFFHWGVPAWGIYAIGTIPLAYRFYVRRQKGLSLANGCEGVTGGHPVWNSIINIIFIFGIVCGIVLSFGTGIPMLVNNLHNSVGTPDTFYVQVIAVLAITLFFTFSSYRGLDKGMKFCSNATTYFCFFLLAYVFIFGPTQFQLENTIKSVGAMIDRFIPMLTETEPIQKTGFTSDWTIFYWAWWITLAPWMWIFIAKISKGRSIREIILCITGAGMGSTILFFGVLSNYGLHQQLTGVFDFVSVLNQESPEQVISSVILSLPLGRIILFIWFITGSMLLITTLDSAVFTLSAASIRNIGDDEVPPVGLKFFWAVLISAIPLCLMFARAQLDALKSILIISAVPVSFTLILCVISLCRWLREDFGHLARMEIIEKERDPNPDFDADEFKNGRRVVPLADDRSGHEKTPV